MLPQNASQKNALMSEKGGTPDPVELIRASAGDLDAWLSNFAPDAIWDASRIGMGVGVVEGVGAIRRLIIDFYRRFDNPRIELNEVRDLGNGITFAVFASEGRIPGGEGVITERVAQIQEWVDGLVVRVIDFRDIDEARAAAACLAEQRADG